METIPASLSAFKPTPNEKEATNFLFKKADSDSLGVLTGDKAVPFFSHASIPPALLGEIWQISDPDNSGFLTPERFGVACRLIGHAQAAGGTGEVKPDWVGTAGPFPKFEGFAIPQHLVPSTSSPPPPTRAALQPQPTGGFGAMRGAPVTQGGAAGNSITVEEKARYAKLFASSGPANGLLDGDKARDIFIKSKLPFETLGQIWNLADTHSRGALDVADFTIGMHLIQHTMNGALSSLPSVLSPALYASATSLSLPASPATASRHTGPTSPLRQSSFVPQPARVASPQNTGYGYNSFPQQQQQQQFVPWEIEAKEKAESDGYFEGIDVGRVGAIEGEAAVGFFGQSGLPVDVLAKVWDLADIRGTGALNKDEFAVALKLIRDKVAGKELPNVLPLSMTPPSLRTGGAPAAPATAHRDLLDLMDDEEPPARALSPQPAPGIFPQTTGGQSRIQPQGTGQSSFSQSALQGTIFPQATGPISPQTTGQPARALSPQSTGFANNFAALPAQQARAVVQPSGSNFFDDNDDADQNTRLTADSATLGNLRNEHSSTEAAVTKLSVQRGDLEASLSATTSAINELHVKLSQARAAHETERGMVEDLQKRQSEQADLLKRARTELITAESDLSALRVERTEIEGNYLRDKEDVRDMKKKMADVGSETVKIKDVLEKLKKEARQQKGLVAISKKQLATAEAEKEKAAAAIVEEQRELDEANRALEQANDSPFDFPTAPAPASFPLPTSPPAASPTASVRSNNPFDRMGSILGAISPQPTGTHSSSPLALPAVAAVAAVGAGAVAATVFGDERAKEEQEEKDPFGFPTSASREVDGEKDPFALPAGLTTAAAPATFDSAFADGFGDDFSSAPVAAAVVAPSPAFDDAFAEMDGPTPVAQSVEDEKVEEPVVEEEKGEPVIDESKEEPVVEEEEVEGPVKEIEEPDSSADEVEIEDATPAPHGAREASDSTFPVAGTSTSDSGESFVLVPARGVDADAESKFPALETLEEPVVTAAPQAAVVPAETTTTEGDTFGDDAAESSVFDEPPPRDSPAATPDGTTSAKKRAAPPPPPHRASTLSAAVSSPAATTSHTTDSPSAFDDAFASSFDESPATTTASSQPPVVAKGSVDDFDDAFSDLPPPAPISTLSSSIVPQSSADFDSFDDDFSFKPDFAPPPASGSAFDDSFADFDAAFEPAHSTKSSVSPSVVAGAQGFSFDDTFGEPAVVDSAKATPPNVPARPAVGAALEDDSAGVKQIVGVGFSRDQAIEALEKYDYDVTRAINSMLG